MGFNFASTSKELVELQRALQAAGVSAPLPTRPTSARPQSAATAATPGAAASVPKPPVVVQPVQRSTQVILPVVPDTTVPDWFFDRTAADVKVEYARLARDREAQSTLTTRSWKEKQGYGTQAKEATIRIRFPEGVCLQLVTPSRKPLPSTGRVADQGLVPATLMNFRLLVDAASIPKNIPLLNDNMLKLTHAMY
eukprot:gene3265-13289_t